jgi:hypothetical protein
MGMWCKWLHTDLDETAQDDSRTTSKDVPLRSQTQAGGNLASKRGTGESLRISSLLIS